MRYFIGFLFFLAASSAMAQDTNVSAYTKKSYMMPTRDGTKLFTVVLTPVNATGPVPFLLHRTPYGSDLPAKDGETISVEKLPGYLSIYGKEGYIFVFQDVRGKFKSEGTFEMNRPLYHLTDKTKTDESTDAWDLVDWLLKTIPGNNGTAGIHGISYPGYLALDAAVDPHPALKASSPQASPTDMFLGDDFHHNGAFRLSYGFEYSYMVENDAASNSSYPFPEMDLYDWYLQLGPLSEVNAKHFHQRLPAWNNFMAHPNYDAFWVNQSRLTSIKQAQIPLLHVGGYYDQEDLNGPQILYQQLEKNDNKNYNYLLLGPWRHGGWAGREVTSLGKVPFGSNTAAWFQDLEKKWFDFWLKGKGEKAFVEANAFQTGSNTWQSFGKWPPANASYQKLFLTADKSLSFQPASNRSTVSYPSDPADPVPYRQRPIEPTYGKGSRWGAWQVEDQRFVEGRPDVLVFTGALLQQPLTITGNVTASVVFSTTASDADIIVKLIDVYPDSSKTLPGYHFPVAMEVFRGRFRKGFNAAIPFESNKPETVTIDLHQVNHQFQPGHRLMVQVQSTWFPVIDRNPQKFVPSIFQARAEDYSKAIHSIHCGGASGTYLSLPVVDEK